MAIQQINLGTAPTGAGGDTQRSANTKINQNFSNPNHAASRMVGTDRGDVMEVGAFGVGQPKGLRTLEEETDSYLGFYVGAISSLPDGLHVNDTAMRYGNTIMMRRSASSHFLSFGSTEATVVALNSSTKDLLGQYKFYTTKNTTTDSNGFIKAASPVIDLYDNDFELNSDAQQQEISVTKNGVGDYTIKTDTGLRSDNTWQIEVPQDVNKNPLFAVVVDTKDDGTINIKCYKRIFSMQTFTFGPDLDSPVDITEGRFISVRLNDNPEPEFDNELIE